MKHVGLLFCRDSGSIGCVCVCGRDTGLESIRGRWVAIRFVQCFFGPDCRRCGFGIKQQGWSSMHKKGPEWIITEHGFEIGEGWARRGR